MRTVVATTKVVNFKQITTASAKSVLPPITVVATTKVVNFKQITTALTKLLIKINCCCYHKGSKF